MATNPLRTDPSRTATLRRRWATALVGSLRRLRKAIVQLVAVEDAFGLGPRRGLQLAANAVGPVGHALASTQLNVTDPGVVAALRSFQASIDPDDVLVLEEEPHVTVRYGITPGPRRDWQVRVLAADFGPVRLRLGRLGLFRSPTSDVLKVEVAGGDPERLHRLLGALPHVRSPHAYSPHLTVAYLRPGRGAAYVGPGPLDGRELVLDALTYSDEQRRQTTLPLTQTGRFPFPQEGRPAPAPVANTRWSWNTAPEQARAFQDWLRQQTRAVLLGETERRLWEKFVADGYKQGLDRAYRDAQRYRRRRRQAALPDDPRARLTFQLQAFGRAVVAEQLRLLTGRTLNEVEGLADDLVVRLQRLLVDGLQRKLAPAALAAQLVKQLGLAEARAATIARTETVRAHAAGQLQAFAALGQSRVGPAAEWLTEGDDRVCAACAELEGQQFTLEEAEGMIPVHPNCRCAWAPVDPTIGSPGHALDAPIRAKEPGTVQMPDGSLVTWVPDPVARPQSNVTLFVDPAKLDAAWSSDANFYIPPGGGGAEIGGRRAGFESFLTKGEPVQASAVVLDDAGRPAFVNGRHRFSVLRDRGAPAVAVTVPRRQAREFLRRFGVRSAT